MQKNNKEEALKERLKKVLVQDKLSKHKDLIRRLSTELQISILDCAAAISLLNQPELCADDIYNDKSKKNEKDIDFSCGVAKQKLVRYRLDIGRNHQVTLEDLKKVLIEVSGVERKRIGWLDIRNQYTLVELPDGMPVDIFQLLSEVEINNQKLNIKRIKFKRRFYKRKNKVENS